MVKSFSALDQAALMEGLRAALASALMLALGCWLQSPDFSWAAIGAFWTSLATAPDTARSRVWSMLAFSVLSTVCGGLTSYAASLGTAWGAAAILLFVTLAGLARMRGAQVYQVGILAATACVVMADRPWHGAVGGIAYLLIYLGGCLFATLLGMLIWRRPSLARTESAPPTPSRAWLADGVHFAMRLGIATTIAYLVVRGLHLSYGYWATMAVLLILQPSVSETWPRSLERAGGTIVGTLIAVVIGHLVHTPLAITLAIFPLIGLTMALRPLGYSVYVTFLTPSFVLVADYATPAVDYHYALTRLGDNLLGSAIALAATLLLWPIRKEIRSQAH